MLHGSLAGEEALLQEAQPRGCRTSLFFLSCRLKRYDTADICCERRNTLTVGSIMFYPILI